MLRTNKFRLYPNKAIEKRMLETLELCRQTYNTLLGELQQQKEIDKGQIQGIIPDMKIADHRFQKLYSKTMQYECYRLFSSLQSLSKTKGKRRNGALRFKGKGWFKTFTYNQSGFKIKETGKRCQTLWLSKIGDIPIRCHRKIKGNIKQITIKRHASGKWYANVVEETKEQPAPKKEISRTVGIDVGLEHFLYDSEGNSIDNPRHLKQKAERLARCQRKLSRKKKGSKNRLKARIRVAKQYEGIGNVRSDFLHKISRRYVDEYDAIGIEDHDLSVFVKGNRLAKHMLDASWGAFRRMLSYKAENAGTWILPVETRGTTQVCSQCGAEVKKELWDREHNCPSCGFVAPRDYNSALEIQRRMLEKLFVPQELRDTMPVETGTATVLIEQQVLSAKQEAPCDS